MRRRLNVSAIALAIALACPAAAAPLHDAAYQGEIARVRQLLASGTPVNEADELGFTALDLARENKHGQTAALLRERGARSGIDNEFVRRLQQRLAFLGYEVGVPDGILGGQTWIAAEAFQRNAGLKGGRGVTRDWVAALDEATWRAAQERLTAIGFDTGTPDGRPGPRTREAIARFRADRGLPSGNALDADTLSALATPARATAPVPAAETVDKAAGQPFAIIENRRRDGKVDLVQARLAYMGYGITEVDGQMGPTTREAIERYQREHGFSVNGGLASDWEAHLQSATHRAVQRRLTALGYDAGTPDGLLGRQSRDAIQAFRRDHGLTDNERANSEFLAALAATSVASAQPQPAVATNAMKPPTIVNATVEIEAPARPTTPPPAMSLSAVQNRLNALGFDAGPADGEMGSRTRKAIRDFQKQHGLAINGKADDPAFLRALAEPTPKPADTPVVQMSLAQIQARLNELGFDAGPADGEMGSRTRKAIRVFQDAVRIPVTGEPDQALMAALSNPPGPQPSAPLASDPEPAMSLAEIQSALNARGYDAGPADGEMGSRTREAIRRFQEAASLTVTGEPDTALMRALQAPAPTTEATASAQTPDLPADPVARRIWTVQRHLGFLGFPAGTPDGQMGSATRSAIQQFERSQGRRATGQLSNALFERLERAVTRSVQQRLATTDHDPGPADGVMGDQTRQALQAYRKEKGLAATAEIDIALLDTLESIKPPAAPAQASAVDLATVTNAARGGPAATAPLGTSDTVTGTLQFSGAEWCEIGSIKLSQDWCTTFRDAQAGDQCSVTLRNGRVIAVRCG